jgi:hypothetical protein
MIKATAKIISNIPARWWADARGQVHGRALPRTRPQASAAGELPLTDGSAERTREAGLRHWIKVQPEQPQEIVWLTPQVGIDYQIETSTDLHWIIK